MQKELYEEEQRFGVAKEEVKNAEDVLKGM